VASAARFNAETGIDQRIAKAGEGGSARRPGTARREPDQRKTRGLDQHADKRHLRAADPIRHVAEKKARRDQRHREGGEDKPDRSPSALRGKERTEGDDCAKADAAQCRSETGQPNCSRHRPQRRPCAALRLDRHRRQARDEQDRHQWHQRRCNRDAGKTAGRIKCRAKRRAERQRREHRHPDPGDDASGVFGAGESESPADRSGNNEALGPAEQRAAE
jgi:hypothetical protein